MASYVVLERGSTVEPVLVRDGFHAIAFLLPVVWLLWHRLWIEALVAFAAMAALSTLAGMAGLGMASPAFSLLVSVFFGLEAAGLRIAALERRGWRNWGVVEGRDVEEAEIRYAMAKAPDEVVNETPAPAAPRPAPAAAYRRPSGSAMGLLGYPGAR